MKRKKSTVKKRKRKRKEMWVWVVKKYEKRASNNGENIIHNLCTQFGWSV